MVKVENVPDDIFYKISSYLHYGNKIKPVKCCHKINSTKKVCKKKAYKKGFCKCHYDKYIKNKNLKYALFNYVKSYHKNSNILSNIDVSYSCLKFLVDSQYIKIYRYFFTIDGKKYDFYFSKKNINYLNFESFNEDNKKQIGRHFYLTNIQKEYFDKSKKLYLCNDLKREFTDIELNIFNDIYHFMTSTYENNIHYMYHEILPIPFPIINGHIGNNEVEINHNALFNNLLLIDNEVINEYRQNNGNLNQINENNIPKLYKNQLIGNDINNRKIYLQRYTNEDTELNKYIGTFINQESEYKLIINIISNDGGEKKRDQIILDLNKYINFDKNNISIKDVKLYYSESFIDNNDEEMNNQYEDAGNNEIDFNLNNLLKLITKNVNHALKQYYMYRIFNINFN